MVVPKSAFLVHLIVFAFLTGCGGSATQESIEIDRSLSDDLTGNSSSQPHIEVMTEQNLNVIPVVPVIHSSDLSETEEKPPVQKNRKADSAPPEPSSPKPPYTEDSLHAYVSELTSTASGLVSWASSGLYDDGSAMLNDEISHYRIVFGTSTVNLNQTQNVNLSSLLNFNFSALTKNGWYVGVQTVSIYGEVSETSNLVGFNF